MHNTYSYIKYKKENEYLAHHGILGQKWGKKNGPPYPLDPEDHSAAEKKENHGHYSQGVTQDRGGSSSGSGSSSGAQNEPQNGKKQIDKKKILKAAAITAGVMTVVGGTSIGVALAVKEPEVFSNAFNDIKSTILQKSSDEVIRNRTKESMTEGFKDKLREDTFNNLNNKDSAQVEARRIHDEATARREERSRDDFRKSMNEGFRNSSSEEVKEARAEADASKAAQEKAKANRYRSDFGKEFGEVQRNRNDDDLAEQMARGRENASNARSEADTKEAMKAQDAAYKARDKENNQYVKEGRREARKEAFKETWDARKEKKASERAAKAEAEAKERQSINDALNRLRNGNYSNDDEGSYQRQEDYNLLHDKDPIGLSHIMDNAKLKMGKSQSEQNNTWDKMVRTKNEKDRQRREADALAGEYAKAHPTSKIGKAKQKIEKATNFINKANDVTNKTRSTINTAKNTFDNVKQIAAIAGGIGTAAGIIGGKKRQQQQQQQEQYQQYQQYQQGGYQDDIDPRYQQQTQQFKKKKR